MVLVKDVIPSGHLLSDSDTGVDYLGESVYADAIAESIHQSKTSITIGIYAKWGSGKSFLLRHVEGILRRYEKQSVADGDHDEDSAQTQYTCDKTRQLCWWIFCLLVIFGVIAVSIMLATNPSIFLSIPTNTTQTTTTNTTLSEAEKLAQNMNTLRNVGLFLIPVEILLILVVGCYGRKWTPGRRYGRFDILVYGAFTEIPMPQTQSEIVEDPGQTAADVLRYAPPGDERLAMAAAEDVVYPRKYIFVNFKAWEYAGSDTLWAAIVTNISDAVEAEFGSMTTRLFRMLTIKEVAKKALGKANRSLYIQFTLDSTKQQIRTMMEKYGVVESLCQIEATSARQGFKWWMITYSNDGEYRNAKDSLKIEGVDFKRRPPAGFEDQSGSRKERFKRKSKERESSRALVMEHIPLNVMEGEESGAEDEDPEVPPVQLDILSRIFCCCNRFCRHFVRHPITLWKLPKLFWWILIPVCCILIPVTAYIVANSLNLDVVRTWREVPIFGQVLLWLPASAAVALAVTKFAWAMCHSQRQRINQALDGTKGRMASQLGFMSKVKNEIQVMTNLIRCARFIHQKDYRVVITIDDLDQVDLKKVHSVLESVNILLSDKSSPFICLIAADPRIVVKCIEESMGEAMKNAKITGREYLKKIINLPVCLPDISETNKKRYVAGLIDQSDRTVNYREEEQKNRVHMQGRNRANLANGLRTAAAVLAVGADEVDGLENDDDVELNHEKFLFEARKFLYDNKQVQALLHGNARNMKRIFNIISMTASVINCIMKKQERQRFMRTNVNGGCYQAPVVEGVQEIVRTKTLAESVVLWIILVDQWPYRTSYIIQVIEDSAQRAVKREIEEITEEWTILDIYQKKVQSAVRVAEDDLLTLDDDPDLFQTYMLLLDERGFQRDDISFMMRLTINLDSSIRRRIAFGLKPPPLPPRDVGVMPGVNKEGDTTSNFDSFLEEGHGHAPEDNSGLAMPSTLGNNVTGNGISRQEVAPEKPAEESVGLSAVSVIIEDTLSRETVC